MERQVVLTAVLLTVLVSGCTAVENTERYGNNTVVEYNDEISQERITGIHSALIERGFESNNANVTKQNASWYTVNLETDITESQVSPSQRYTFQQTATLIEFNSFQRNETLQLRSYNTNGELISVFTQ